MQKDKQDANTNTMKKSICLTVDADAWTIAKTRVDNLSASINDYLISLAGKSEEDKTIEQLRAQERDTKIKMQELSITLSLTQQAMKDVEESKALRAKQTLEDEQFKRWKCPVCKHLNFMTESRCAGSCGLKTRDESITEIVSIKEVV